jgi:hypothetical protein
MFCQSQLIAFSFQIKGLNSHIPGGLHSVEFSFFDIFAAPHAIIQNKLLND